MSFTQAATVSKHLMRSNLPGSSVQYNTSPTKLHVLFYCKGHDLLKVRLTFLSFFCGLCWSLIIFNVYTIICNACILEKFLKIALKQVLWIIAHTP